MKPAVTQTEPPACIVQLNTISNECTVDLTWDEDPGILPGFANRYILGDVYLRSITEEFCSTLRSPRSSW